MLPKTIDKIETADILALVSNSDEERRTMDFKRELPGDSDKDKHELRADVTSFANSGGGDLIFGVEESSGVATAVVGLAGIDADAEIRRIEAIIQSGIDPRVPGFESRAISIPGKGQVIVVRVPKSWRGPHLVKINDTFRMFGRNSKGKYIFDATEIRSAFALSAELPERIRRWRDDRLAKIVGRDAPVELEGNTRLTVHLLPLSSFTGNFEIAAAALAKEQQHFQPLGSGGWDHRINIDGILQFVRNRVQPGVCTAYCQVFRSGRVEAVTAELVDMHNNHPVIGSGWLERVIIEAVRSYLDALVGLGVATPMIVMVAATGAKGARFIAGDSWVRDPGTIDRDFLLLPEVLIESHPTDVPTVLRPLFDAMWNAAGFKQCFSYDKDGKWQQR